MKKAALAAIALIALVALAACGSTSHTKTITVAANTPPPVATTTATTTDSSVTPCTQIAPGDGTVDCDPQGMPCPTGYSMAAGNCWDDGSGDSSTSMFDPGSGDTSSDNGPLEAKLGKALPLQDQDAGTVNVNVTSVAPFSAGEYDSPDAGKHYVGVVLRFHNVGTSTFSDSPDNDVTLLAANGDSFDSTIVSGGCENDSGMKLGPGSSRNGCVAFEVPNGAKLSKVQVTLSSGFSDVTGEWKL